MVFRGCHQNMCSLQQRPWGQSDSFFYVHPSVHPFSMGVGVCGILSQLLFLSQSSALFADYTLHWFVLLSFFALFILQFLTSLPISVLFFLAVLVPLTRSVHQPATRILSLQSQIKKNGATTLQIDDCLPASPPTSPDSTSKHNPTTQEITEEL